MSKAKQHTSWRCPCGASGKTLGIEWEHHVHRHCRGDATALRKLVDDLHTPLMEDPKEGK